MYLKGNLVSLNTNAEMQSDVAMLCPARVRVNDKCLLFTRVGDGTKRIKQPTHKVISFGNCFLSDISVKHMSKK